MTALTAFGLRYSASDATGVTSVAMSALGVLEEEPRRHVDILRVYLRLVALDVHDYVRGTLPARTSSRYAVGARVVLASHLDVGAERPSPASNIRSSSVAMTTAEASADFSRALPDVLDEALAADREERLAGKARRGVAGGDDDGDGAPVGPAGRVSPPAT